MSTLLVPLVASIPSTPLDFGAVKSMGWMNLVWVAFVLFIALMFKTGKIGFESIRRGEKGMRELLGWPAWPVFHGAHFFIKGVLGVSKAPIIPTDVALKCRAQLENGNVIEVEARARTLIGRKRKSLVKAIYSFEDEDRTDLENASRTRLTRSLLHNSIRQILTGATSAGELTEESLRANCAEELLDTFASTLERLYIDQITPVDAQIIAGSETEVSRVKSAAMLGVVPELPSAG